VMAIAAFAKWDIWGGVNHTLAAAGYIAVAAQASSQLGGGAASAPSGTFTPSQPDRAQPTQQTDARNVFVQWNLSKTSADLGRVLSRADYDRQRSYSRDGQPEGIRFE